MKRPAPIDPDPTKHAFNPAFHPKHGYVQFCRVCNKTKEEHTT